MNLDLLQAGHRIRTRNGREAEVLEVRDGKAIQVAYLHNAEDPFNVPKRTGDTELLGAEEVDALLGAVPPTDWDRELAVILHYVPESDDGPAEYRAETLSGVPNGVVVRGGSENSARGALNHLLGGLALMGFRGVVSVDDAAGEGFERYEIEVPDTC